MHAAAPALRFELLPSGRGVMLLRFRSPAHQDHVVQLSPIFHDEAPLTLERLVDTGNLFNRTPRWLAYIALHDFPLEHWFPENIAAVVSCFNTVIRIDRMCLTEYDFTDVHLVVDLHHRVDIPGDVWLHNPVGSGCIIGAEHRAVWPWAGPIGPQGQLVDEISPPGSQLQPAFPPPPGANLLQYPQQQDDLAADNDAPAPANQVQHLHVAHSLMHSITAGILSILNTYPMPPLPTLPIVIHISPPLAAAPTPPPVMLLLTWHPTTPAAEPLVDSPPPAASN